MGYLLAHEEYNVNNNPFKPAWWLPNPHLQTMWPVLLRRNIKNIELERERVELPDGDFIDMDWVGRSGIGPLVLILHGFEGSIESHYAKGMLQKIVQNGWRGVFMHFRGCSGEPNRLPRNYHSGETSDVAYIVNLLRERDNNPKIAVIGYSLGGNVLLKWLGETGNQNPLKAAIAISVPFELHKASQRIQHGFSRCYQWYFLKCLRERLTIKYQYVPNAPLKPSQLGSVRTIMEFDNQFTAPLHGFANVDEYYTKASSRQYLRGIQVPTLILHAKDDPFMSEDVIPEKHELSPHVNFELTEAGGHVGFVTGKYPWRPEYWLEHRVPEFLKEQFIK
jgi:hypothetical protein